MAQDTSQEFPVLRDLIGAGPGAIVRFGLAVGAWSALFFGAWWLAQKPISMATAWGAARLLEIAAPVDRVAIEWHAPRATFVAEPDASLRYRRNLASGQGFELETNPSLQTFGLPLLLGLVAATRARRRVRVAVVGSIILLALASAGVACEVAVGFSSLPAGGAPPLFSPNVFQASLVALGYQLGTLIFPTLVPVILWFWLLASSRASRSEP